MPAAVPESSPATFRRGRAALPLPALAWRGAPSAGDRLGPWLNHRWLQGAMVLAIACLLVYDRYILCQQYLFRYLDEDQALMWYAAHEILHGRLHEPCFFGQDYNSCLEGYLAAPLIALHLPYNVAVPLVTVVLGLLPFFLIAAVAWWRRQSVVAGAALLVPLLMPVRYGIITGIPRGFVTGIAIASIPAVLLLPAGRRKGAAGAGLGARRIWRIVRPLGRPGVWAGLRYFAAGALAVAAAQINPNCLLLLAPVGVYAALTHWREWRFWTCGAAGLLAAAAYPICVYRFYYVEHPDYVVYLRGATYTWGYSVFQYFLQDSIAPRFGESPIFKDLVPMPIGGTQAPMFVVAAGFAVAAVLLIRGRRAALAAAFTAAMVTLISFGYERVQTGRGGNSASYPYARMYLAIPVVFAWLFLVNYVPRARFAGSAAARWLARGALAGMLIAAVHGFHLKQQELPDVLATESNPRMAPVCPPIPVDGLYALAREVQRIADEKHADLLLVGGGSKHFAYALPALTTVETLFVAQNFERRTWRPVEEATAHHQNILLINFNVAGALPAGGGFAVTLDGQGNPVEDDDAPPPAPPSALPPPRAPTRGRGGRGGRATAGLGGFGGGFAAGGGGGRGRGGGRGVSGVTFNDPASLQQLHTVEVPPIDVLNAGGRSVYDIPALAGSLPRLIEMPPTPEYPHPSLQVVRRNWPGR